MLGLGHMFNLPVKSNGVDPGPPHSDFELPVEAKFCVFAAYTGARAKRKMATVK